MLRAIKSFLIFLILLLGAPMAVFSQTSSAPRFSIEPISDSVFAVINGKSFNAATPVRRADLRYLRIPHYNAKGEVCMGEMICNKAIATQLIAIFRKLYEAKYPIERMRLIDNYKDDEASMTANNTSCFNTRPQTGSSKLSRHAYGMAVDINPLYNPYVKTTSWSRIVEPSKGMPYVDRTKKFPFKIDANDLCRREFRRYGFQWGGAWTRSVRDYQHFEK